ncbi:hypothetical protein EYF80_044691 [Liparis tanakae]|uniref:Uncharacterized protein n=1 Tax=Liparis tanakae TaxID=230148 RepID=A0A4Z2FV99_9TELE|nr:hypothetical protein EYF80_044691 [Liparis tanakae]
MQRNRRTKTTKEYMETGSIRSRAAGERDERKESEAGRGAWLLDGRLETERKRWFAAFAPSPGQQS